jgi:hypothetical protein
LRAAARAPDRPPRPSDLDVARPGRASHRAREARGTP